MRGTVVTAIGAAALLGVGAGTASAEPTPSHAGWDGSKYWHKDATGRWRWTSHKDRYEALTGKTGADSARSSRTTGAGEGAGAAQESPSRPGTTSAVQWAKGQLGKPYIWGGNGPHGFDCSGLVQQAYRHTGIELPRVADAQFRASTQISRSELRPGDLVFWSSDGSASGVHHVAVHLGDGRYVEAPRPGKSVRVSSFAAYHPNLYGRVS